MRIRASHADTLASSREYVHFVGAERCPRMANASEVQALVPRAGASGCKDGALSRPCALNQDIAGALWKWRAPHERMDEHPWLILEVPVVGISCAAGRRLSRGPRFPPTPILLVASVHGTSPRIERGNPSGICGTGSAELPE